MMEAIHTSDTSVITRATWRNIPEDGIPHSHHLENLKSHVNVDCYFSQVVDVNNVASPLMDVERNLAFLLGLHAHWLSQSTALQPAEEEVQHWLRALFLQGGLQVLQPPNPYEEEKGEARSTSSTAGTTPTEPKTPKLEGLHKWTLDRATAFLQALAEHRTMVWF
jgi:hypothetical protein